MKVKSQSVKNFLLTEIERQRQSLFLWVPVLLGSGVITYFWYNATFEWGTLSFSAVLIGLAVAKSYRAYVITGQNRWLSLLLISISLGLFLAGFTVAKFRDQTIQTTVLQDDLSIQQIEGILENIVPLEKASAKRIILADVQTEKYRDLRVRLKSYHFKGDNWQVGDRVTVKAKLMAPSGPVMPQGFDFSRKAYFEGISAVGYTVSDAVSIEKSIDKQHYLASLRSHIGQVIYKTMEPRYAALAQALLVGERSGIFDEDAEALRHAGLAHLLAISGLHVGLIAGCMFFFVRLMLAVIPGLALRYPIKKWAAVAAIAIAFSYMLLAGATVPTVRAFIMTSLVLLAIILDRTALNMRLVALAATFVILTTPEAIMGPSFVLSFAAVSALIVFYKDLGRKWFAHSKAYYPLWRPVYYLFGIIVTSIIATLATAPFSVLYFNRFALYSVLSNVLALPLMGFIVMPFLLLSTLLMPIANDTFMWGIVEWGIAQIIIIAHSVSSYDYASLVLPAMGVTETFLIVSGFLIIILWHGWLRLIGGALMIIGCVLLFKKPSYSIMVAEDMGAILFVDKTVDNLFLYGKMNSYIKQNWLGYYGYDVAVNINNYNTVDNFVNTQIQCDDFICRYKLSKYNVTLAMNPLHHDKACKQSNIIVSPDPFDDTLCPHNPLIIDRFDVWRHGAHRIDFTDNAYEVYTVR